MQLFGTLHMREMRKLFPLEMFEKRAAKSRNPEALKAKQMQLEG